MCPAAKDSFRLSCNGFDPCEQLRKMDHAKKVPFRVCLPAVLSGFVCPAMEDSFRLFCYTVDWLHVAGNEIICFSQNVVTLYNKR